MLTPKKDLRDGLPLWAEDFRDSLPKQNLLQDITVDVAIIGSGISAAFVAEELSGRGFSVAIFDRRVPMMGSTAATTALLQYELDVPLSHLDKDIGFDQAARAWQRSFSSLQRLVEKTNDLGISCNLREESSLYLSGNVLPPDELRAEGDIRSRANLQSKFIPAEQLKSHFGLEAEAALHVAESFSANPLQMASGFLRKAVENGAVIFSPVDITETSSGTGRVYLSTKNGQTITATFLVFCTGYEVPKQLQGQDYKILSTWAIASGPETTPQRMPMIWQASDPYLYLRQHSDGRMICGGEDEDFSDEDARNALTPDKTETLERKISRLLGRKTAAEYAWCGSFGVTPTGMPLIGAVPGMRNTFALLAFGGNGIVGGRIGAEIIGRILAGEEDPDLKLYAFKDGSEK